MTTQDNRALVDYERRWLDPDYSFHRHKVTVSPRYSNFRYKEGREVRLLSRSEYLREGEAINDNEH